MNMKYCRFQNTLEALRECANALQDADSPTPLDLLSPAERAAAVSLLRMCAEVADDFGGAV